MRSAYWEYEQRGGHGTDYRTRTYGLVPGSEYHAYRPKKSGQFLRPIPASTQPVGSRYGRSGRHSGA